MKDKDLHEEMRKLMIEADNRCVGLIEERDRIEKDIEYWAKQGDAARTLAVYFDTELKADESLRED